MSGRPNSAANAIEEATPSPSAAAAAGGNGDEPVPLRPVWKAKKPVTREQIQARRDEFWSTAPSFAGQPQVWQAIRTAAEMDDEASARAILDAMQLRLPHGDLRLVFDERGTHYEVPAYCLSYPQNLAVGSRRPSAAESAAATAAALAAFDPASGEPINVKLRLSTGSNHVLQCRTTEPVGRVLERLNTDIEAKKNEETAAAAAAAAAAVAASGGNTTTMRLFFLGRHYEPVELMSSLGLKDKDVVQVFVT